MGRWSGFTGLVGAMAVAASAGCGNGKRSGDLVGSGGAGNSAGASVVANGGAGGVQGTAGAAGTSDIGGTAGTTPASGVAAGAAGQGVGGTAGDCGRDRLATTGAASIYRDYLAEKLPNLNPAVLVEARELVVAGLWDVLHAQLFDVQAGTLVGNIPFSPESTILTRACQVFFPAVTNGIPGGALSSGLVANGAFYSTWIDGANPYSTISKMVPNGAQFTTTFSPAYSYFAVSGQLVLQASGADILVLRVRFNNLFNEWPAAEPFGTLKDLGDSLVIVDDAGNPIPNSVP